VIPLSYVVTWIVEYPFVTFFIERTTLLFMMAMDMGRCPEFEADDGWKGGRPVAKEEKAQSRQTKR